MRSALIFRERLLPPSETFIVAQAKSLRRYQPFLTGLRRVRPSLDHSIPEILFSYNSGVCDKIAAGLYRKLAFGPEFFRLLRSVKPSVLHAHFAVDAIQALPIANKLDLPLIVSLHGYDVTSTDDALSKSFSGRNYLAKRQRLFQQASAFLCVSHFIRDAAIQAGFPERKLHVHYTGVDCTRFRPSKLARDPKLILFVGRLVEKKGCDYLLRAMEIVQHHDPEAHVEIIGDGPLRPALEARATRLALRARFLGTQSPEQVLQRMSQARILCNPSVTAASGDKEGFGMVFAEAQAVGTPVVSFAHAAIPEAVSHGETGLLCPEKEAASLADCLLYLLDDDALWHSTSERASKFVQENFNLARQTQRLESIYDNCVLRTHPLAAPAAPGLELRRSSHTAVP